MGSPFLNISWSRPFIPALLDLTLEKTNGDLSRAYFVFPHARPALYLTEAIRNDTRVAKPCVLPRTDSVAGLFTLARAGIAAKLATPVGLLDQVALLLHAVRELREERGGLLRDLPLDDSRRFFPWGVRLASLMEEFLTHNIVPDDYIHVRDEVTPFAAALLENLGALHERYLTSLDERGWTTPGLDAFRVARSVAQTGGMADTPLLEGKHIILAGFHTLTGAQNILFRHLWETRNATICLHADPHVAPSSGTNGSLHWSCAPLVRWANAWHAAIHPFEEADAIPSPEITASFRAGYDVHSQLGDLAHSLQSAPQEHSPKNAGTTAIVLPDTSLLLPVLHHLPDTDVNISMGYPLARSPLFRLIDSILTLQETRKGLGPFSYHWKAIIGILRHPYLKMLYPENADGGDAEELSRAFRRFLYHAEKVVRSSERFRNLSDLAAQTAETFAEAEKTPPPAALAALFGRILTATVFAWEQIANPEGLATALESLVDLMRERGSALWKRFPIDAECLYRLTESVIPQLAHTALKEEPLPRETLAEVLRQLLHNERVPFEAYPLVGNQVMGMLETRLLHFDRVIVLDVTDDQLPGKSGHDPLLPEALRALAGLPGARGRENVAAYTFFRLAHGAKELTLYWQEGVEAQGLNDAKKIRGRFVEELIWMEEQRRGRILAPEKPENKGQDGPLRLISCMLPPVPRLHAPIPVTPAVKERIQTFLEGEISPSSLDAYIRCPAKFFYQRIGRINEVEEVLEGRDARGIGLFLHDVLSSWFTARQGLPVTADGASIKAMRDHFFTALANSPLYATLPADDRVMLEEAAPPILFAMLENHEGRLPLFIEEKFGATLSVDGQNRRIAGRADRVDETAGGLLVLDYKTKRAPFIDGTAWGDEVFWERITAWTPSDEDALPLLTERFESVQLPAYMHILAKQERRRVYDAAYTLLTTEGKEVALIGDECDGEERERIVQEKIPALLAFVLRHMEHAKTFSPNPGKHCDWCLHKNSCIVATR